MSGYVLTPQAEDDLLDIWSYIALDSTHYADRVESQIHESLEMLSKVPMAGRVRHELTSLPVRFWSIPRYRNYLVVYSSAERPLRIIRILHAARDARNQLNPLGL